MTELMKHKAKSVVQSNLIYLDEVIEATIVNLLADEGIDCDQEFLPELQEIYNKYISKEEINKQNT